jgi:hypothetical protein
VASEDPIATRRQAPTVTERERTIAVLSDRFAQGELDMETFEERVTLAHRAADAQALAALTADLSTPPAPPPAPAPSVAMTTQAPASASAVAIFGGTRRTGTWVVPHRLHVRALFGGVEIDLRDARLPAGPIDITVDAAFGGVQIIVPPTLAVEMHGTAIFGGFEQMERASTTPDPGLPTVRVQGRAIFGGVSVETRLSGESQRMAHRRRHRERRARRHAHRGWD